MRDYWQFFIEPLLQTMRAKTLLYFGDRSDALTELLAAYAESANGHLHIVDGAAGAAAVQARVTQHASFTDAALGAQADIVFLQSDPNWYTTRARLSALAKAPTPAGQSPAPILVADIAWPYARRDGYRDTRAIPSAYVLPNEVAGLRPGVASPVAGGLYADRHNALTEGTFQNGVLTAVEDFLIEHPDAWGFYSCNAFGGLGVLWPVGGAAEGLALVKALGAAGPQHGLLSVLSTERLRLQIALEDGKLELSGMTGKLAAATRRAEEADTREKAQKADWDVDRKRVREQKDALAQKTRKIEILRETLRQYDLEMHTQREAAARGEAATAALSEANAELVSIRAQLEAERAQIAAVQTQLQSARDQASATQAQLAVAQGQVTAARTELAAARDEGAAAQVKLAAALEQAAATQAHLVAARAEAEAAQAEMAALTARAADNEQRFVAELAARDEALVHKEQMLSAAAAELEQVRNVAIEPPVDLVAAAELVAAQAATASAQREVARVGGELSEVRLTAERTHSQLEKERERTRGLTAALTQHEADLARSERSLAKALAKCAAFEQSRIWRLTAPYRALRNKCGKGGGESVSVDIVSSAPAPSASISSAPAPKTETRSLPIVEVKAAAPALRLPSVRVLGYAEAGNGAARSGHIALLEKSCAFDADYYRGQIKNGDASGDEVEHYLSEGASAGLDPGPFFNTSYYVARYPLVAASGVNPLVDYLLVGAELGRNPNPDFDTDQYRRANPDLSGENPLEHFIKTRNQTRH